MLYLLSDHLLSEPLPSSALKILCIHVRDPGIYNLFQRLPSHQQVQQLPSLLRTPSSPDSVRW